MCSRTFAVLFAVPVWACAGTIRAQDDLTVTPETARRVGEAAPAGEPEPDHTVSARIARAFPPGREELVLALTTPGGEPRLESLDALSILARPHAVEAPGETPPEVEVEEGFVAPGIKRLDAGLLVRLARIAERFPDRRIEIVSGYRPRARRGSRHRHGRALDVRVDGVTKEELAEYLRTLPETGVGFYPNSDLTHIDVREESHFWVDRSGPGERPDYGSWPPTQEESSEARRDVMTAVRDALDSLRDDAHGDEDAPAEEVERAQGDTTEAVADASASPTAPAEEEPPMTDAEYVALRASIREALRALR